MTREEAIEVIEQDIPCEHDRDLIEALEMAISALKEPTWQEKLEKEYLFESIKEDMTKLQAENERLFKEVEALKGEWILDETDNSVECNKCGCQIYPNDIFHGEPHFCPNCGADMREPIGGRKEQNDTRT